MGYCATNNTWRYRATNYKYMYIKIYIIGDTSFMQF